MNNYQRADFRPQQPKEEASGGSGFGHSYWPIVILSGRQKYAISDRTTVRMYAIERESWAKLK